MQEDMQKGIPVLILTTDKALWAFWQGLGAFGWSPVQAVSLTELSAWKSAGHQLAMLDMALPAITSQKDTQWQQYFAGLHILALSSQLQDTQGQQMLLHGASGYAPKHLPLDAISRILQSIQDGAIWMGRSLLRKLLEDIDARLPSAPDMQSWQQGLTAREIEVAQLAAIGQNNAEIAHALAISERTVRAHLSSIFDKLAVVDRLQLALMVHGVRKPAAA